MVWKNPGHEFDFKSDKLAEQYKNKIIYVYGAGLVGKRVIESIQNITDWKVKAVIDADSKKHGSMYCGIPVVSLKDMKNKELKNLQSCLIIMGLNDDIGINIKLHIDEYLELDSSVCVEYGKFIRHDFPVIAAYTYEKIFVNTLSFIITERCTLNCEKCAIMLPYFKHVHEYSMDELKKYANLAFDKIDMIGDFTVTGGEPFLNRNLCEILTYVGEHYRSKISSFKIISNGTIFPDEKLINALKKYDIVVEVSDYTKAVPAIKEKVEKTQELFRENNIKHYFLSESQWVDFGFEQTDNNKNENGLRSFFQYCNTKCRGYIRGQIWYCINGGFAEQALEIEADADNCLELEHIGNSIEQRRKIVEFDLGYNRKGYINMCRRCNGTCEINKNYIEVGRQCQNHSFQ